MMNCVIILCGTYCGEIRKFSIRMGKHMSKFDVKTEGLKVHSDSLQGISRQIESIGTEVLDIANAMRGCSEFVEVKFCLSKLAESIGGYSQSAKSMQSALDDISSKYQSTETKLTHMSDDLVVVDDGQGENGSGTGSGKSPKWSDLGWDSVGSFGALGQMFAMMGYAVDGNMGKAMGNWAKSLAGFYKEAESGGSDLLGLLPNGTVQKAGDAFGDSILGGIKNGDLSGALGTMKGNAGEAISAGLNGAADEYKLFGEGVTAADKVSASANWAAAILDNGFDNYDEYKNGGISAGRAVAETAVETAVDVGMDIGANAAIGIAAAALTPAAPAVAVGLAASAAVWGINAGVEYFTGKDCGEWAADFVCDGIEAAGNGLSAAADWAGDKLSDAAKDLGDLVSSSPLGSVVSWAGF